MTFSLPLLSGSQFGANLGGIASSFLADLQGVTALASKPESPPAVLQPLGTGTVAGAGGRRRRMQGSSAPLVEASTCAGQAQLLSARQPGSTPSSSSITVQALLTQAQASALLLLFYQGGLAAGNNAFGLTAAAYASCLQQPFALSAVVATGAAGAVLPTNTAPWTAWAQPGADLSSSISVLTIASVACLLAVLLAVLLAEQAGMPPAAAAAGEAQAAAQAVAGAAATAAKGLSVD